MSFIDPNWQMSGHDKFWAGAVLLTILASISFASFQFLQMIKGTFFPSKKPARRSQAVVSDKKGDKYQSSGGTTTGSVQQDLRETRSRGAMKRK